MPAKDTNKREQCQIYLNIAFPDLKKTGEVCGFIGIAEGVQFGNDVLCRRGGWGFGLHQFSFFRHTSCSSNKANTAARINHPVRYLLLSCKTISFTSSLL